MADIKPSPIAIKAEPVQTFYVEFEKELEDGKTVSVYGIKRMTKSQSESGEFKAVYGCVKDLAKTLPKDKRCAKLKDGSLVRYGLDQNGKPADPDQEGAVPWPCVVFFGDDPAEVAGQSKDALVTAEKDPVLHG